MVKMFFLRAALILKELWANLADYFRLGVLYDKMQRIEYKWEKADERDRPKLQQEFLRHHNSEMFIKRRLLVRKTRREREQLAKI